MFQNARFATWVSLGLYPYECQSIKHVSQYAIRKFFEPLDIYDYKEADVSLLIHCRLFDLLLLSSYCSPGFFALQLTILILSACTVF